MCGARRLYVEEMILTPVQTKSGPYAICIGLERSWLHEQQLQAWELYTALPRACWIWLVCDPRACSLQARYDEFLRRGGSQFSGIPLG